MINRLPVFGPKRAETRCVDASEAVQISANSGESVDQRPRLVPPWLRRPGVRRLRRQGLPGTVSAVARRSSAGVGCNRALVQQTADPQTEAAIGILASVSGTRYSQLAMTLRSCDWCFCPAAADREDLADDWALSRVTKLDTQS